MNTALPDSTAFGWIKILPAFAQPYAQLMRLDRPIGSWLLVLPCWWGLGLGAHFSGSQPQLMYALLFFVGAVVMRGAGCVWNDYLDREIDAKVFRTALRPLPSGRVKPYQALIFLAFLLFCGLLVALMLPLQGLLVAVLSLVLVAFYPLAKRVMDMPQLILGLVFSWGALVGFVVQGYGLFLPALLLYMGSACWVIAYDTIYAMQDLSDDLSLGIGSSALALGNKAPHFVMICYAFSFLLMLGACVSARAGFFSYVGLIAFALHLTWQSRVFWQAQKSASKDEALYLKLFISNREAGLLFILGLALDFVFKA